MHHITVAPSTQALLGLVRGPALLSKHVQIGKYIVDAMVIDAHPEVAQWYGYHSPAEMQGRYLSQLHDPRCLAQVRLYAVARKLGLPGVPTEYDIQITLPTGTRRWLRKQQIRQITDGGDVYWVSRCLPIDDIQVKAMPAVTIPLSPAEIERYLGRGTLADVERIMAHMIPSTSPPQGAARYAPEPTKRSPLDLPRSPYILPVPLAFPHRLRQLRRRRRLSQKALAQRAGVTDVTISRLEQSRDASHIAINTAVRLAQALDVRLETLLGLDDKPL